MTTAVLPLVEHFALGLQSPICLTWELTYACNLACAHCLSSSGRRDPRELSTAECKAVIDELERRLDDLDLTDPLSININGCQNSCARIQVADIGLKGQLIAGEEFGFQVHLGGGLVSADQEAGGLGRTVRGLKVTAANLAYYIERVVRRWHADRTDGETFATGLYTPVKV